MQFNNLQSNQSNNTYNASFAPNTAADANQQQGANPQAVPVPPLGNAADLSANPAARNLQEYQAIRVVEGASARSGFHLFQQENLETIEADLRRYDHLNKEEQMQVISAAVQFINSVKIDAKKYEKVTLFIGQTGAGKSTLINYLAGAEIKGKWDEERQTVSLDIPNMLKDISVGHGASSCTFAPMPYEDTATGLVYFDCPGFMDTRGVLHEIIAAKLIQDVIRNAEQVNFVVTLTESCLADRGHIRVLQETIDVLETYAPDFETSKNSMLLVVTKGANNKNRNKPGDESHDISYFTTQVAGKNGILNESSQNLSGYQRAFLQSIHDSGRFTYSFKADIEIDKPVSTLERGRIIHKIQELELVRQQEVSGIKVSDHARLRSVEFAKNIQDHIQKLSTSVVEMASKSISDFYSKAVEGLEDLFHQEDTKELTRKLLAFKEALGEVANKVYLSAESFFTDLQALLEVHQVMIEESMLQNIQNILAEIEGYESDQSLFRKIGPSTMDISNTPLGLDGKLVDLYQTLENLLQTCTHLLEYQPIKPGLPYMQKLEDEVENERQLDLYLTHVRNHAEIGNFEEAKQDYESALKYTDSAKHYKGYAACLTRIYHNLCQVPLSLEKDETKERVYKEKASRAFYCLGELYAKQEAWKEAQTSYKASCELALYEVPLKALVDVARQIKETVDIADALEKLADFYVEKGAITLAIDKLEEAFKVLPSIQTLQKLEMLYVKEYGENSQLKVDKTRILQFELQINQEPKNIELYREYGWFLKSIGRHDEARAVKKRMDKQLQAIQRELFQDLQQNFQTLQQKVVKQKDKIRSLRGLQTKTQTLLKDYVLKHDVVHTDLQKRVETFENVQFPAQTNSIHSLNDRIAFLEQQAVYLDFSSRTDIQDADLISLLHKNPYIKLLNLQGCQNITDAGLAPLKGLKWLTSLNLSYCKVTDAGLRHLSGLTQLTSLNLQYCNQLTDAGLRQFAGLTTLTSLGLAGCTQVTDAGLQHLARLTQLTSLGLAGCTQVTDTGLQHLARLTQLTSLNLQSCYQLTDAGLGQLTLLTWLSSLNLGGCTQLSNAGLGQLAGLTQLRELYLESCTQLTDVGLRQLARLTQLISLNLQYCKQLSDAGLQCLAGLTRLTSLSLGGCTQLTDAGLRHLARLTQLNALNLSYCNNLTTDAKQALRKQILGLRIQG